MSARSTRRLRLETLETRAVPSLTPAGAEFQVNGYTPGYQRFSDTTVDSAGNFLVAWFDENDVLYPQTGAGITMQKYDPQGNLVWGPIAVAEAGGGIDQPPAIASDSAGNFAVIWARAPLTGTDNNVYGRRYDSLGQPLSAKYLVSDAATSSPGVVVGYLDLAMIAAGDSVATWTITGGANEIVKARRFLASGGPAASEFVVNSIPSSNNYSSVAMADDGSFAITWQVDYYVPRLRRFAPDGTPLTGDINLNSTTAIPFPTVRLTPSGDGVIGMRTSTGYQIQPLSATGVLGPQVNTGLINPNVDIPELAINAYGGGIVLSTSIDNRLLAREFDAGLNFVSAAFQVNTTPAAFFPSAAVDLDGDTMVVWAKRDAGNDFDLLSQRYIGSAPRAGSPSINNGTPNRSTIESFKLNATRVLTLPANPADGFELKNQYGTAFSVAVDTAGSTGAGTKLTFTFPPTLPDGRYTFRIKANLVRDDHGQAFDGNGDGIAGDDYVTGFIKLKGDFNGDAKVDLSDFVLFRNAFAVNDAAFDLDGDGDVDVADFSAFRQLFGRLLP